MFSMWYAASGAAEDLVDEGRRSSSSFFGPKFVYRPERSISASCAGRLPQRAPGWGAGTDRGVPRLPGHVSGSLATHGRPRQLGPLRRRSAKAPPPRADGGSWTTPPIPWRMRAWTHTSRWTGPRLSTPLAFPRLPEPSAGGTRGPSATPRTYDEPYEVDEPLVSICIANV